MIDNVIGYMRENVLSTHLFNTVYGLCELIIDGNKTIPSNYKGKGEYHSISNFDSAAGLGYFREDGPVSLEKSEFSYRSCDKYYNIRYPLLFVGAIKKIKLACDNAYASHMLALSVCNVLTNTNGIGQYVEANNASSIVTGYSTDGSEILKQEYKNPSSDEFNLKFAYISVSFEVSLTVDKNCIGQVCYSGGILPTTPGPVIRTITRFRVNIVPTGPVAGVYTLPETFIAGSLCLYYNGNRLVNGIDYIEGATLNTFTLTFTPLAGTSLIAEYLIVT